MAYEFDFQIWIDQCDAVPSINARFGLQAALSYILGEKLDRFVMFTKRDWELEVQLPRFLNTIRSLFQPEDIDRYLAAKLPGQPHWWPPCGRHDCIKCPAAFRTLLSSGQASQHDLLQLRVEQLLACRSAHHEGRLQDHPSESDLKRDDEGEVVDWRCSSCKRWILTETDTPVHQVDCPLCWRRICKNCTGSFYGACIVCQKIQDDREARLTQPCELETDPFETHFAAPEDLEVRASCVDCGSFDSEESGGASCSSCSRFVCGYCADKDGRCGDCGGDKAA